MDTAIDCREVVVEAKDKIRLECVDHSQGPKKVHCTEIAVIERWPLANSGGLIYHTGQIA